MQWADYLLQKRLKQNQPKTLSRQKQNQLQFLKRLKPKLWLKRQNQDSKSL